MRRRVTIVCGILHPRYGGPSSVVRLHAAALGDHADVTVFGCAPPRQLCETAQPFRSVRLFKETWPRMWFRGRGLRASLLAEAANTDVIHAHMLWDHAVWAAWQACRKHGKPLIITPHGSASATWRLRGLQKRLYSFFVLRPMLRETAFLHALTQVEAESLRSIGGPCKVRVVPNGLPISEFRKQRDPTPALLRWPLIKGKRVVLYLGRLWWQKGLDILPEAWKQVAVNHTPSEWILVVAGPDYRGYRQDLLKRIADLGLDQHVLLTGPVDAEFKESLFAAAEVLVLPSRGEGLSMVLLEAMAAGIPAVYTRECGLPELAAHNAGWEIPFGLGELTECLREVTTASKDTLSAYGTRARALGIRSYTIEQTARDLVAMYQDALARLSRRV